MNSSTAASTMAGGVNKAQPGSAGGLYLGLGASLMPGVIRVTVRASLMLNGVIRVTMRASPMLNGVTAGTSPRDSPRLSPRLRLSPGGMSSPSVGT